MKIKNEEYTYDEKKPGRIKEITTNYGKKLYVLLQEDVVCNVKFKTALNHWAGAFLGKSSVKYLCHQNGTVLRYEVKVLGSDGDTRLVANKVYKLKRRGIIDFRHF